MELNKVGTFENNTFISPDKNQSFSHQEFYDKGSRSLEKNSQRINESFGVPSTTKNINTSLSKRRLRPLDQPISPKFSLSKNTTPKDISFDNKLAVNDRSKNGILPPLNGRLKSQGATKRKIHRKMNEIQSNSSFDVGLFSEKALKLLERSK